MEKSFIIAGKLVTLSLKAPYEGSSLLDVSVKVSGVERSHATFEGTQFSDASEAFNLVRETLAALAVEIGK